MADQSGGGIDTVMHEERLFPPPGDFAVKARVKSLEEYEALWNKAAADPVKFWGDLARDELDRVEPFQTTLRWNEPIAEWFVGGKTNACYNCVDKHVAEGRGDDTAIVWEGEPGDQRTLTYAQLLSEVSRCADALKALGIGEGDVVSLYMPMTPELAIAMLACALHRRRIHSVIFAGFSAEAIADRNHDSGAKVVITADGGWRRGKVLPLKATVDQALEKSPTVEHCIVLKRAGDAVNMQQGRDHWWHDLVDTASDDCPAVPLDSEAPLFILYTSGSTGKPKGIKHTTAGYNLFARKLFNGYSIIARTTFFGVLPTADG